MFENLSLDGWIVYLVLFVFVLVISWIISAMFSKAKAIRESVKATKRSATGWFSTLVLLLVVMIILLLVAVTRVYTAFAEHEQIAIVGCRHANNFGRDAFELLYTPIVDGVRQEEQSFIVKGEKWGIGGDILEWQNYMTLIGFNSMYRLTRIQGGYINAEDEMTRDITAFPLVEDEQSDFWKTLSDLAVNMPFVKSVHQNFVSTYPYFGDTFSIYATPSGFTLERFEDEN